MQALWVAGTFVISIYMALDVDSMEVCEFASQLLGCNVSWVTCGDFNATPAQCPFIHTFDTCEPTIHDPGDPTRWEGKRCIDYFASNTNVERPTALDHFVADHTVVQSRMSMTGCKNELMEVSPAPRLPKFSDLEIHRPLGLLFGQYLD